VRPALILRAAPLLLVPVLLLASTFPGQFRVSPAYWALSCCAALVFAAGWRWPVAASFALSALAVPLLAAEAWGVSGLVPYLGALAVADVAARSDRDSVIGAAALAWTVALLVGNRLDAHTTLWNAVNIVTILAGVGVPLLLGLYLRGQRRLAAAYRERAADAELRSAAAELAIRAQERTAMARELHDLVAHHMASIVLRVGVAEHVLHDDDPRVSAVLTDVHATAADALDDIRRLQEALRDPALREVAMIDADGLWVEIDAAVARTRAAGFNVVDRIDRGLSGVDAVARLTLLRVTQEALTNVMKHALVTAPVEVTIGARDDGVAVVVGSAAQADRPSGTGGHGVIGMTERLELIGGRLDVRRDASSWVVDAWLPAAGGRGVR
jgi:signal transduction histidine kinase